MQKAKEGVAASSFTSLHHDSRDKDSGTKYLSFSCLATDTATLHEGCTMLEADLMYSTTAVTLIGQSHINHCMLVM